MRFAVLITTGSTWHRAMILVGSYNQFGCLCSVFHGEIRCALTWVCGDSSLTSTVSDHRQAICLIYFSFLPYDCFTQMNCVHPTPAGQTRFAALESLQGLSSWCTPCFDCPRTLAMVNHFNTVEREVFSHLITRSRTRRLICTNWGHSIWCICVLMKKGNNKHDNPNHEQQHPGSSWLLPWYFFCLT